MMKAFCLALIAATSLGAAAQPYPAKPVRVIVPYGPGGSTDLNGRTIAAKLQEALGQPFVVENKPGASAMIGAAEVARAAPDGHTLLVGSPQPILLNPLFFKEMPYAAETAFAPVAITLLSPNYIFVDPSAPVHTVQDLIAWAKANPGRVFFASSGNGSSGHLTGLLLNKLGGIDMQHIGYKGSAGAVADVIAGRVPVLIDQPVPGISHVRAGKLRAVATGTTMRVPALPNLQTAQEQGLAGFESSTWFGFFAPAGTPRAAIDRLWGEIQRIVKLPDVRDKFEPAGYLMGSIGPDEAVAKIRAERSKWSALVREAGVKPE